MSNSMVIHMRGDQMISTHLCLRSVFFQYLYSFLKKMNQFFRNFLSVQVFQSIEDAKHDTNIQDMLEFQKGDQQAFYRIYQRNKRNIYSWAYRMLQNEATAEEISQEVFIRIFKMQKNYKPTAKFTTLLYTITSRLVFNETRRKSRHPEDRVEQNELQNFPDVRCQWMNQMEREQKREILERAIQKVPERQRAVLMLRYMDEMSHEEISGIMELKIQAVKSLLHRGLVSLMEVLKKEGLQ